MPPSSSPPKARRPLAPCNRGGPSKPQFNSQSGVGEEAEEEEASASRVNLLIKDSTNVGDADRPVRRTNDPSHYVDDTIGDFGSDGPDKDDVIFVALPQPTPHKTVDKGKRKADQNIIEIESDDGMQDEPEATTSSHFRKRQLQEEDVQVVAKIPPPKKKRLGRHPDSSPPKGSIFLTDLPEEIQRGCKSRASISLSFTSMA